MVPVDDSRGSKYSFLPSSIFSRLSPGLEALKTALVLLARVDCWPTLELVFEPPRQSLKLAKLIVEIAGVLAAHRWLRFCDGKPMAFPSDVTTGQVDNVFEAGGLQHTQADCRTRTTATLND